MELRWNATDSQLIYADGSLFCGAWLSFCSNWSIWKSRQANDREKSTWRGFSETAWSLSKGLYIAPLVTGRQAPCNISGCCGLGWEPFQGDLVLPPFRGVLCTMNHGSISVEFKGGHHLREPWCGINARTAPQRAALNTNPPFEWLLELHDLRGEEEDRPVMMIIDMTMGTPDDVLLLVATPCSCNWLNNPTLILPLVEWLSTDGGKLHRLHFSGK